MINNIFMGKLLEYDNSIRDELYMIISKYEFVTVYCSITLYVKTNSADEGSWKWQAYCFNSVDRKNKHKY